jgi:hypothetical protein
MAFKIYHTDPNDCTKKGTEIISDTLNNVFPAITSLDRLEGNYGSKVKLWIESDYDTTIILGFQTPQIHEKINDYLFMSANDDDCESDLAGSEDLIAGTVITEITDNQNIKAQGIPYRIIFRDGETAIINGETAEISTATTDSSTGEVTITFVNPVLTPMAVGDTISSSFTLQLQADTPKPFWRQCDIDGGLPYLSSVVRQTLFIGY